MSPSSARALSELNITTTQREVLAPAVVTLALPRQPEQANKVGLGTRWPVT
jgi:hypothetical protein